VIFLLFASKSARPFLYTDTGSSEIRMFGESVVAGFIPLSFSAGIHSEIVKGWMFVLNFGGKNVLQIRDPSTPTT
jgi:hypothetical protein